MYLVVGASGYVGTQFTSVLKRRGIPFSTVGRRDCDLYDANELTKLIDAAGAERLINCAGYTGKPNVDACETDKANCLAGNAVLPGVIAQACENVGIPWGHVSSGCIFTGRRGDGEGFSEDDLPNFSFRQNNSSFYSGTKALGEEVLENAPRCYIWRLRIPFSEVDSQRNYLSKLMRYDTLLEVENSLSCLPDFVNAAIDCFDLRIPFGSYNLTNPGAIRTSEVVELIKESGLVNRDFRFFDNESEFMRLAAKTPRSNCVLDVSKALSAGLKLPPVRDAIRLSLQNWVSELHDAKRTQRVSTS